MSSLIFRVSANDEPHGVFSLSPHQQAVVVDVSGSEVTRALALNVTRLAGLFGNASVGYKISGEIEEEMDMKEILGEQAEGRIFFREKHSFTTVTIPINNQVGIRVLHTKSKLRQIMSASFNIPFKTTFLSTSLSAGVFVIGGDVHDPPD